MFYQKGHDALDGADGGAVDDECAVLCAVCTRVGKVKFVGHTEVVLHGEGGVLFAVDVFHLDIYLGTVECGLVFHFLEIFAALLEQRAQERFALLPRRVVFVILFGVGTVAEREPEMVVFTLF